MAAKPDYVRDVMYRWIRYCAVIGATLGVVYGFVTDFDTTPDKCLPTFWELSIFLAVLGAFMGWFTTGMLGLVRWLFLGYE